MGSKKRKNPTRHPVTMADLKRAKKSVLEEAIRFTKIIIFTVLLDKHGQDREAMREIWEQTEKLSMSIAEGRVNIADLACVLREEYGIDIQ